jgi:hypothetical protein
MKRLFIVGLFCSVVLTVRFLDDAPVAESGRGQGGVTVSGNGDVNADESLDLSDAIYLLAHLFQGGPAPEACPLGAGGAGGDAGGGGDDAMGAGGGIGLGLPDTGAELREIAKRCWDSDTERCRDMPGVIEQVCGDGVDNDNDGRTDCADPDCDVFGGPAQGCFNERDATGGNPNGDCTNNLDDDGDGLTDCDDPDCGHHTTGVDCGPVEIHCDDGADGDSDGLTDCADPDCIGGNLEGNPIDCTAGPPCPGQDGFYSTGCSAVDRYGARSHPVGGGVVHETVTDRCTGLMWQRDLADLSGDGVIGATGNGQDRTPSWCEALRYCENLTYAGFSDWRLPNARELESLADRSGPLPLAFGQETQYDPSLRSYRPDFWSSTPSLKNPVNERNLTTGAPGPAHVPAAWLVDLNFNSAGTVKPAVDTHAGADTGFLIEYRVLPQGNLVRAVRTFSPGDFAAGGAGAGRGGGGGVVSGNGDVNADNGLDLSDAIYLLAHLFQGGPPPEPCPGAPQTETTCDDGMDNDLDTFTDCDDSDCAGLDGCPEVETDCTNGLDDDEDGDIDCADPDCSDDVSCPEDCEDGVDNDADGDMDCSDSECTAEPHCGTTALGELPRTGATQCYDDEGNPIACANNVDCPGQDGDYQAGCALTGVNRFEDHGDGTVTDHCTNLMWQKDSANTNGDGVVNDSDKMLWCEALTYCEVTLNAAGGFAGQTGWRLPNVRELHSIVDFSRENPAMDANFFDATGGGGQTHWSSTSIASTDGDCEWLVFFDTGRLSSVCRPNEQAHGHIRAVRDAP